MNPQAILCLKFLRDAQINKGDFNRGYVMGYINGVKYDFAPWERIYIDNVANQIIWQGKSA